MPQRDEVDEMVGMEMADDDGVEQARVEQPGEPRERALAEIEQETRFPGAEQVGRPGRAEPVRVGGTCPDDVEPHRAYGRALEAGFDVIPGPLGWRWSVAWGLGVL